MSERAWWLYILLCADGSLYTGITSWLERRLRQHARGQGSKYTKARRPLLLLRAWQYETRGQARAVELVVKRWRRRRKENVAHYGDWLFDGEPMSDDVLLTVAKRVEMYGA